MTYHQTAIVYANADDLATLEEKVAELLARSTDVAYYTT